MITDSFDNKTEPLISLKDFYGDKKEIIEICLVIFSKELFRVEITNTTRQIIAVLINKSKNVVIHCFTHFSNAPSFLGRIYIIIGIGAIICK